MLSHIELCESFFETDPLNSSIDPLRACRLWLGVGGVGNTEAPGRCNTPSGSVTPSSISSTAFGPAEPRLSWCGDDSQLDICVELVLSRRNRPITDDLGFSMQPVHRHGPCKRECLLESCINSVS